MGLFYVQDASTKKKIASLTPVTLRPEMTICIDLSCPESGNIFSQNLLMGGF